jgi:hypothetical protein
MKEYNGRSIADFESRLEHVDAQAVDVLHETGANAARQNAVRVGSDV